MKKGRDYERSEYTDPRNTVIVRLWKKAQKNIEAVERGIVVGEKGVFPLGHWVVGEYALQLNVRKLLILSDWATWLLEIEL